MSRRAVLAVVLAACRANLAPPASAQIGCTADSDCPSGYACKPRLGRCVSTTQANGVAPSIVGDVTIDPSKIGRGQSVTVSFLTSTALAAPPTVTLDPGSLDRPLTLASQSGQSYALSYTAVGDEPEGDVPLSIDLVDTHGTEASIQAGVVTFDFTGPTVSDFAWQSAPLLVGATAVLTLGGSVSAPATVTSAALVDQSGNTIATLDVALARTTDATTLALLAKVDLSTLPLTGVTALAAALDVTDDVGNSTATTSATIAVDSLPPTTTLVGPAPASPTLELDATIAFTSPDTDVAGFECSLDGAAFAACASPWSLIDLLPGNHTATVRAFDTVGNRDPSPPVVTWTIERRWTHIATSSFSWTCGTTTDQRLFCWGSNQNGVLGRGDDTSFVDPSPGPVAGRWLDVSVGSAHSCAIATDHSLWCFGDNESGNLGLGFFSSAPAPAPVQVGTATDWAAISVGRAYSCGIRDTGGARTVWCWGSGNQGQLGVPGVLASLVMSPTQVGSDTDWVLIAASSATTCGIRNGGAPGVYCFGDDSYGQIILPTTVSISTPTLAFAGDWLDVRSNVFATCAVNASHELWCRGRNDGAVFAVPTSNVVQDWTLILTGMTALSADAGLCAVGVDGTLWAWGIGDSEGVGLGLGNPQPAIAPPQQVGSDTHWVACSTASSHAFALRDDGTAAAMGTDIDGVLGLGFDYSRPQPPHPIAASLATVQVGTNNACGLDAASSLWCWGVSYEPSAGTGVDSVHIGASAADHPIPTTWPVSWTQPVHWVDVGLMSDSFGGVRDDGTFWVSGSPIGPMSNLPIEVPALISNTPTLVSDWTSAQVGESFLCGLRGAPGSATVWCIGGDGGGQLGDGTTTGTDYNAAHQVGTDADWLTIAVGDGHTCGIRAEGTGNTMWCWGDGSGAANCSAPSTAVTTPTLVGSATDQWLSVAAGETRTCAIRDDGAAHTLWCWGYAASGSYDCPPVQAPGTSFAFVAVGTSMECAITDDAGVRPLLCRGNNSGGILEVASSATVVTDFMPVGSDSDWQSVALGRRQNGSSDFSCGQKTGGAIWCWGMADDGQLGDDLDFREAPTTLPIP